MKLALYKYAIIIIIIIKNAIICSTLNENHASHSDIQGLLHVLSRENSYWWI